jgi:erythrin-vacuolar iron transport family protein
VFLIGAASAVRAGISMAFSEDLSDDGEITGRGNPVFRGLVTLVTGFMTFIGRIPAHAGRFSFPTSPQL